MEKKNNTNLLLIALILVLLISAITIVGTILLINSKKGSEPAQPKMQNKVAKENVVDDPGEDEPKEVSDATDFDLKFLKLENNGKNNIYSPLSLRYALYMLRDGADEKTLEQIEDVLGEATDVKKYENIDKVLSFANTIFIRDTYKDVVKEEYVDQVEKEYDAEINYDKFESVDNINKWIENKTLGQIKDLLKPEAINPDTEMALINALAIDMEWMDDFDTQDTYGKTFYLSDGKEMTATTMNKKFTSDSVSYYEGDDVTAVSLDLKEYGDKQLSFVAIMPNDEKLTDYVEDFEISDLEEIENNMKTAEDAKNGLELSIPKFKYDYSLDLRKDLEALGMTDAFIPDTANFSNMTKKILWVDKAIHSANIDFSEEGVKAAAVTVFMMMDSAMVRENEPVKVEIDKPFLYFIKDKKSGEIWFVGTLYEPNNWENDKADYYGEP